MPYLMIRHKVEVYVNPAHLETTLLEPGATGWRIAEMATGLVMFILSVIGIAKWMKE